MQGPLNKIVIEMHDMVPDRFGLEPEQLTRRVFAHTQPSDRFYVRVLPLKDTPALKDAVVTAATELGAEVRERGARLAFVMSKEGVVGLSRRREAEHIFLEIPMTQGWRERVHAALTPAGS